MKSTCGNAIGCGALAFALATLCLPTAAQAGGRVSWSVGIYGGAPAYRGPAPVYVQPRPVYVQPQPIYVQPRPVYVQPQPYYVMPQPHYGGVPVVAPPIVVAPRALYPIGWAPRGHWRHRHDRGPGWRY